MILGFALVLAQTLSTRGIAIAMTGMVIVFAALVLVTLFISVLPGLVAISQKIVPEVQDRHVPEADSRTLSPNHSVVAAIGFALHTRIQQQAGAGDPTDHKH